MNCKGSKYGPITAKQKKSTPAHGARTPGAFLSYRKTMPPPSRRAKKQRY